MEYSNADLNQEAYHLLFLSEPTDLQMKTVIFKLPYNNQWNIQQV